MEGKIEEYSQLAIEMMMAYAPKVLLAIITLIVGFWIINRVLGGIDRMMKARLTELTLQKFLHSLLSVLFKALLLISAASMVGIETTSFIAILGAAGLAVGLALQGSLANFAGGVLILLFKPFKVGDFVEGAGVVGVVREIQIFNTIITTGDNKRIIVPNGALSNGVITNYSAEATRRVDLIFGIGYGDDVLKAKEVLKDLLASDERVLKEPGAEVYVKELGDSSVNFVVRAWVNASDYWPLYFAMQEKVKIRFDQDGISIPFPQRDVHLYQHNA